MIKVGCCGYPVAAEKYYKAFGLVEINKTFYEFPRMATVEKWREKAPVDFEFTVKAHKSISHQHKLDASEPCLEAFEQARTICEVLKAKILLVQTAASFAPDKIDVATNFFRKISRDDLAVVWETRGSAWETKDVRERLANMLQNVGVSHVTDLFKALPVYTDGVAYFRLHGLGKDMYYYQYTDEELMKLYEVLRTFEAKGKEVYVLFNNLAMFDDALRFKQFLRTQKFPKITSSVGLESVKSVIEKTRYPIAKAVLLKRFGWRLVELENGKQVRLGELLKDLPRKEYGSAEEVLKAVKPLIKS